MRSSGGMVARQAVQTSRSAGSRSLFGTSFGRSSLTKPGRDWRGSPDVAVWIRRRRHGLGSGSLFVRRRLRAPSSAIPTARWLSSACGLCPTRRLEWAASLRRYRERCLFMVAPDFVGDAQATLELSLPYLPTIRQLGYKAAFVSQNGACSALVPWDLIDCLFVGGDDAWKFSDASCALISEAKARGKWTHCGRVNTLRRLQACAAHCFDSADGTYLKYGPDVNWPKLCGFLDQVNTGQMGMAAWW